MKSRKFKFKKDYYLERTIFLKDEIEINKGVTILTGCNGAGKSTLEFIMKYSLRDEGVLCLSYDNFIDGGKNSMDVEMEFGDTDIAATMALSSEGENININIGKLAYKIGSLFKNNKDIQESWIFFDAIDSGYSIDNIIEFKKFINMVLKDAKKNNNDLYIIISANSYEMTVGLPCFDVISGEYIDSSDIDTYEKYKDYILKTHEMKVKLISESKEKEE